MKGTRGFTLMEALVAFGIVAIALSVLVRGVGLTGRGEARAETILAARSLAQDRMARLGREIRLTLGESRGAVASLMWTQSVEHWHDSEALASGLRAYRVVIEVKEQSRTQTLILLETVKLGEASSPP